MPRYRLTPLARDGLTRSLHKVRQSFGSDVAERVRRAYLVAFRRVAQNPNLGHYNEELAPARDVLFLPVGPGMFAYRQVNDIVEVVAVDRGERDWSAILDDALG